MFLFDLEFLKIRKTDDFSFEALPRENEFCVCEQNLEMQYKEQKLRQSTNFQVQANGTILEDQD